jgi:RimJ/RimL family protein N-acetyltransferase
MIRAAIDHAPTIAPRPGRLRSPLVSPPRYQITWSTSIGELVAVEPRADELAVHAAALAAAYNDPHNAPLLGHTEPMTADDVIEHYAAVADDGGHNFLVYRDGALVADADLRHVAGGAAELAFLVAAVSAQGQGLGTRIAMMLHALAFGPLQLERVYASIIPDNVASRRVFDKLGYAIDDSPAARAYADEPGDLTMVVERAAFERSHAAQLAEIEIAMR